MSVSFDNKAFQLTLDHNCFETRDKWRNFTKDPIFEPRFEISGLEDKQL
jgi:hypothetical protein